MFSLFGPPKKLAVHRIQNGKYLDLAKEVNVSFFFKCRMQNKLRKALVGAWYIIQEDNEYVFWGYPIFQRLFSDTRMIDRKKFYKTNREALRQQFPNYKTYDGPKIKTTVQSYIAHEVRQEYNPENPHTYIRRWKGTLQDKTISIEAEVNVRFEQQQQQQQQPKTKTYHLALDKNNLELLHIDKIAPDNELPWIEYNQ